MAVMHAASKRKQNMAKPKKRSTTKRSSSSKAKSGSGGLLSKQSFNWPRSILFASLLAGVGVFAIMTLFASEPSGKIPVPTVGAHWGILMENGKADNVLAHEAASGRKFAMVRRFYDSWNARTNIPTSEVKAMADGGRYVHISIKTSPYKWTDMASGARDAEIAQFANRLKDWNKPVMLTVHHEPDGTEACDWPSDKVNQSTCMGTAADYKAMSQRFYNIFKAQGANNVSFAYVTIAWNYTAGGGAAKNKWVMDAYPGNNHVDWVGVDAYNFLQNDAAAFEYSKRWKNESELYDAWYQWAKTTGKPLALTEWGSLEDPTTPGRKAEWFKQALVDFKARPEIKAVVYFDKTHTHTKPHDWHVNTSTSAANAFYEVGNDAYFNPQADDDTNKAIPWIASPWPDASQSNKRNVTGTTPLSAGMKNPEVQPVKVDFYVDNKLVATATKRTLYGWLVQWDSRSVTNGEHSLKAVAVSSNGKTGTSDTVKIYVSN